jgi:hypothetical protein
MGVLEPKPRSQHYKQQAFDQANMNKKMGEFN